MNPSAKTPLPAGVLFEDEHLLVVNKPAGWNTHAPAPFAGEGIYDWLKHREPRWAALAIIHRLDKETSGVIVFGKTPLANRTLTQQFEQRTVRKKYRLLTDRPVKQRELVAKSKIARAGERYASGPQGELAETRFSVGADVRRLKSNDREKSESPYVASYELIAEPLTGRTHQIRVHAAENGFPILGDTIYGGAPYARVCLHAAELTLQHPATGQPVTFTAPVDFTADARLALRAAIQESIGTPTNAFRLIHSDTDGWPGWQVDKLGDFLLSQAEAELTTAQREELARLQKVFSARGAYHKILSRQVRRSTVAETSPQLVLGEAAPPRFTIHENGVAFELSFNEGYSVGIFLDQRDNRRRLLTRHVAANFPLAAGQSGALQVLNTFAYTCGFSVGAARAGAQTTSLDLSKKYLDWGRRNFTLNGLEAAGHDFIYGDTFDWLKRFAKKGRTFDVVLLDPPTFSQSKAGGVFRAEKDFGKLVRAALPVLAPGILFASTNAAGWPPEQFLECIEEAVSAAGRKILQRHYVPQPPDFPVSRATPAYLKTAWFRID